MNKSSTSDPLLLMVRVRSKDNKDPGKISRNLWDGSFIFTHMWYKNLNRNGRYKKFIDPVYSNRIRTMSYYKNRLQRELRI